MKRLLSIAALALGFAPVLFAAPPSSTVTLKEAVTAALSTGPGIRVAKLTLNGADAQLNQAKAKAGLSLSASTAYSHEAKIGNPPAGTPGSGSSGSSLASSSLPGESVQGTVGLTGPSTKANVQGSYGVSDATLGTSTPAQQATVGISLSQTVYDGYPGGRAQASVQQAEYSYQLAELNYNSSKESVIYSVEQAYYTLLGDQQTVHLREAQLKQSQEDLARTNAFFKANQVTKLDVLTAQIAEQTAQANLTAARNTFDQDRSSLAVLLGWPIDKKFTVAATEASPPPSLTESQAVQTALANRTEIKQYEINRANTNVGLKSAESQRLPVVSVNGSASYNLYPGITPNIDSGTWNAGVSVSVPVFDSGLVSAQVRQARDSLSQIATQEAQAKQNITIDVRKALFGVKDSTVRLKLAQDSVKQAEGEYQLEKTKFSAGLASNLDVLNASVTLINAQDSLQQAKTNLNLSVLSLEQAMGTLSAPK